MFNLDISGASSRAIAVAVGTIVGAIAFSSVAFAGPLSPSSFTSAAPVQAAPPQEQGAWSQLPARLQRQAVSYPTREAPGTIIIDTPNTYLYYVLGCGQAIRYGIGVGRDGVTWCGT